jgi:RNA polymerase sigma factor (sigma-70 family)
MTMRATTVEAATRSDLDLRAELARWHYESHAWAVRCCRSDVPEAEDVLHVVYVKVLDGRAVYAGRSSFKTWLFGVIRQTAREHARRNWLRFARLERWWQAREPDDAGGVEGGGRALPLRRTLAALSRRQQEVLHLVFYQDLTIEEAAQVLSMPVGTARTHYERGKARLRRLLQDEGGSA